MLLIAGLTVFCSWSAADNAIEAAQKQVEIAPLRNLLAVVHEKHPGRVLDVELEQEEHGDTEIWIYEVKMLTRRGRVYELEYDAVTLKLLNVEGRRYGD